MNSKTEIIYKETYQPEFHDAEADGKISLRGYMGYFQDMATHYMHNLQLGNDTLPEEYRHCWIFTKYKVHIEQKAVFNGTNFDLECWIEKEKSPVILHQDIEIKRNGKLHMCGRLELCLFQLDDRRLNKLSGIDFPREVAVERKIDLKPYVKPLKEDSQKQYCYTHIVKYTDLDKSMHMNNLRYIDMLLNVFDSRSEERRVGKEC